MSEEKGFFGRLVEGLNKTRDNIVSGMDSVFGGFSSIDDDFYEELEEVMIMGDLGVTATYDILDDLKEKVKERHIKNPADCRELLIESIRDQMSVGAVEYEFEEMNPVIMVVGVNGVGKTTTIGKLAGQYHAQGKRVIVAAADTFRTVSSTVNIRKHAARRWLYWMRRLVRMRCSRQKNLKKLQTLPVSFLPRWTEQLREVSL